MKKQTIVLIGFMGVGKTTVGERVAERLQWQFIDSDEVIEKQYGMPVKDIFRIHGEGAFRKAERETITRLCQQGEQQVLSLGGGAYMQSEVRRACLQHAIVVYLEVSWWQWEKRMAALADTRPLLQNRTPKQIRGLFEMRRRKYAKCHIKIKTDRLDSDKVTDLLIQEVQPYL